MLVIRFAKKGYSRSQIARTLKCTEDEVYKTIDRYKAEAQHRKQQQTIRQHNNYYPEFLEPKL